MPSPVNPTRGDLIGYPARPVAEPLAGRYRAGRIFGACPGRSKNRDRTMSMRRAVITGMGVVSPVGSDLDTFWDALMNGRSGIAAFRHFDAPVLTLHIAGEGSGFDAEAFLLSVVVGRLKH